MYWRDIRKKIKCNPRIDCIYLCLKSLRNIDECKKIIGIKRSPYSIEIKSYGDYAKDKWIYFINLDKQYNTNGFCSLLLYSLLHLAYADAFSFEPVVCWGENTLYYDKAFSTMNNVFEYYFENVSNVPVNKIHSCYRVTEAKGVDRDLFYLHNRYEQVQGEIERLALIVKKYIRLKPLIKDEFWDELCKFTGNRNTLGVHVRATDFNAGFDNHPKVVTPKEYLETTKDICSKYGFDRVFLATDDAEVVCLFKETFGDSLYYYENSYRSLNGDPVHYGTKKNQREYHQYLLGIEIIKDIYTLGSCAGLVAGRSNVSECARIINKCNDYEYKVVEILDKGINRNHKKSRKKIRGKF